MGIRDWRLKTGELENGGPQLLISNPQSPGAIMLEWQNLEVWKEAHRLTLEVYQLAKGLPPEERFRLSDQMCRSASSVAANIVEGHVRHSRREYIQFLYIARASAEEARYHLLLSKDLGYLKDGRYNELDKAYIQVAKMLNSLISSLKRKDANP